MSRGKGTKKSKPKAKSDLLQDFVKTEADLLTIFKGNPRPRAQSRKCVYTLVLADDGTYYVVHKNKVTKRVSDQVRLRAFMDDMNGLLSDYMKKYEPGLRDLTSGSCVHTGAADIFPKSK
jgi:hypothetical protein